MSTAGIPPARLGRGDSRGSIAAWACNGCGAIQPRPYCLACGLRGGKADDFRPTRPRRIAPCEVYAVAEAQPSLRFAERSERSDPFAGLTLREQTRFLIRWCRRNPDRVRETYDLQRVERLARERDRKGREPWTLLLWLLRRECPGCGERIVGSLKFVGTDEPPTSLLELVRRSICGYGCGLDGAPPTDWQERLAEVRAAKLARGEFRPGPIREGNDDHG